MTDKTFCERVLRNRTVFFNSSTSRRGNKHLVAPDAFLKTNPQIITKMEGEGAVNPPPDNLDNSNGSSNTEPITSGANSSSSDHNGTHIPTTSSIQTSFSMVNTSGSDTLTTTCAYLTDPNASNSRNEANVVAPQFPQTQTGMVHTSVPSQVFTNSSHNYRQFSVSNRLPEIPPITTASITVTSSQPYFLSTASGQGSTSACYAGPSYHPAGSTAPVRSDNFVGLSTVMPGGYPIRTLTPEVSRPAPFVGNHAEIRSSPYQYQEPTCYQHLVGSIEHSHRQQLYPNAGQRQEFFPQGYNSRPTARMGDMNLNFQSSPHQQAESANFLVLNGLRELLQNIPTVNHTPEFWGKDHESPTFFLRNMERYFQSMRIPDVHRTATAAGALKGSAAHWWGDYRGLDFTWEQFEILLTRQYDSPTVRGKLQAQLYSERQNDKESVGVFLHRKSLLFRRLHPQENEISMVVALLELIRPTIRQAIRASGPRSFDDLLSRAVEAEHDEKELTRVAPKKDEKKPLPKSEPTTKGTSPPSSLPRCWHCPERHFNRDCPVLKQKNEQSKPQNTEAENWRGAAPVTAQQPGRPN